MAGGAGGRSVDQVPGGTGATGYSGEAGMAGITDDYGSGSGGGGGATGGGAGGSGGAPGPGRSGTAGAAGEGGTLLDFDGKTGGSGGAFGGAGGGGGGLNGTGVQTVVTFGNVGTLVGGNGGAGGTNGNYAYYASTVSYGAGGGGGSGGFGAIVTGTASNTNGGTVAGGNGGGGGSAEYHPGSGGDGGVGLMLTAAGANVLDSGIIEGGVGGSGGISYNFFETGAAGRGGDGLSFAGSAFFTTITASGKINGGVGGNGSTYAGYYGGVGAQGGTGLVGSGGTIINAGTISGGVGGDGGGQHEPNGGRGGDGIAGSGISIVNMGTISGGQAGRGFYNPPNQGYAIRFTGGNNTLSLLNQNSGLIGNISVATSTTNLTFAQEMNTSLASSIVGNGSITKTGAGTLLLSGANTYNGSTTIEGGTLELDAAYSTINNYFISGPAGFGSIGFDGEAGRTARLILDPVAQPASGGTFGNILNDFGDNDVLDLKGFAFFANASATFDTNKSQLTVTEGGSSEVFNLTNPGATTFFAQDDGSGGTLISDTPACFMTGTRIRTTQGEVAVEDLQIGDVVVSASGLHCPIRWIGYRAYARRFANINPELLPICVTAGALADDVPARDLRISPKHALYLENVLIPVEALVNGTSIFKVERAEDLTYWHVELDTHDVIFAENTPAESFVDDESRGIFHNAHTFPALYPDAAKDKATYCAQRLESGPILAIVRARLAERASTATSTIPSLRL